jgi:nitrite reductase/ring-hydroxylating ferredoxin subunit
MATGHFVEVFAYQNFCVHVGHPLNWSPGKFLTKDKSALICASHGATYEIETGYCYAGPGNGRALRKVDVEIRDGVIYVTGPDSM